MQGEHGVEKMDQPDSLRLRDKPKEAAIPVERPRQSLFDHLQTKFVIPVEEARTGEAGGWRLVGEFDGGVAKPPDADDIHITVGRHSPHEGAGSQAFQYCHFVLLVEDTAYSNSDAC